jgi:UDP-3-O-[3-hydroxymyristoyl] N-acetylglucosamine deacetylase/3-hydroxyacyl-[acyl-carrier-protein] dehydratase
MSKQKTLKGSFSLCGKGLHTGLSLTVTFNPAPENTGYKIQRIDLDGMPIIQAIAENVIDTQRGTVLQPCSVVTMIPQRHTTEHSTGWIL